MSEAGIILGLLEMAGCVAIFAVFLAYMGYVLEGGTTSNGSQWEKFFGDFGRYLYAGTFGWIARMLGRPQSWDESEAEESDDYDGRQNSRQIDSREDSQLDYQAQELGGGSTWLNIGNSRSLEGAIADATSAKSRNPTKIYRVVGLRSKSTYFSC